MGNRPGNFRKHDPNNVMEYVINYKKEHDGNSPTIREISEACKISSTSVVMYVLRILERAGKIHLRGDRNFRHIEVVGGEWRMQ